MIASVRGEVLSVGLDRVVVEVGGVGMLVNVAPATAASMRLGSSGRLHTSLVVREDSLTLYGFMDAPDRDLFETVQTVSGVGPRLALALLSVHSANTARAAIASGDLVALTKVPGIGRRGAERIVLELRDKMGLVSATTTPGGPAASAGAWRGQVREALVGLGWSVKQADDAVEAVAPLAAEGATVPALLKAALQRLGR